MPNQSLLQSYFRNARSVHYFLAFAALGAFAASGLASCSSGSGNEEPLPEGTGAIVASLSKVPDDVRCVQIHTSDWRTPYVQAEVTPGSSASIRIAPLSAGYITLWGAAYSGSCGALHGEAGANQTWEATPVSAQVQPGRTNYAQLTFRRLGGLEVNVEFEECPCDEALVDAGVPGCECGDVDGGPIDFDAGPPIDFDANLVEGWDSASPPN
jgi:hypothetical protein